MNAPVQTSGTAIASLVLGICAWFVLPIIGAIAAVICGHIARGEIRSNPPGSIEGSGMALAGMILGYLQIGLCILVVLFWVGVLMLVYGLAST